MEDWVRNTSVLCYALISEVNLTISSYSYVLQESVALDSVVDIWLRLLVKVDNLSIATTFEVEYTIVIPSVLIVTDQLTLRVCRQCSLTCTRKTEEDSCILTVHIAVSRAVHRSHTLQWQEVVHHREHTLLHLTTIPCIDDNLLLRCYVESNTSLRVQTELLVVLNLSLRSVVNNEVWLECLELLSCRTDEHVCYEVSLPSNLNDETNSHTSILVSTAETIYNIEILVAELLNSEVLHCTPNLLRHWVVIILIFISSPPYSVL
ncbi:Uncharacterised protein [Segatella copri]|nr:Uncharacterised protein [Segatella copri]